MGIQIAVEQFWNMGCRRITVFLPAKRQGNHGGDPPIPEDQRKLQRALEDRDIIRYTPGRYIKNKFIQSYDDRFILQLAANEDGIVVSNDHFRDLLNESPAFKKNNKQPIATVSLKIQKKITKSLEKQKIEEIKKK